MIPEGNLSASSSEPSIQDESSNDLPRIVKGRVQSISIFEMSEIELETLERGSRSEAMLNLMISAFTTAVSFLATLLTIDLTSKPVVFTVFTVIAVIGFASGIILLVLWLRTKSDRNEVIKRIRGRIPAS